MAWNTGQIYDCMQFLTRKNQTGLIASSDFFYSWNIAQAEFMQDQTGRFQKNNNSKSGASTGLIENQAILTTLAIFFKTVSIGVAGGLAPKPGDFKYAMAIRETTTQTRVWTVAPDQWWSVIEDVIDPPSIEDGNFYTKEIGSNFVLLPSTTASIDLDYCTSPSDINWASIPDAQGRPVYDPSNSVQPLWTSNTSIIEITKRALLSLGVSFHDQDFTDFGKSATITGE